MAARSPEIRLMICTFTRPERYTSQLLLHLSSQTLPPSGEARKTKTRIIIFITALNLIQQKYQQLLHM